MSKLLGGQVVSGKKEYGPAQLYITEQQEKYAIREGLKKTSTIWMSHGDEVVSLPNGFIILGSTDHVPFAFVQNTQKKIYGVQFHPEAEHTEEGIKLLKNFLSICHIEIKTYDYDINAMIAKIKKTVGNSFVLGAVSGGVDSTVASVLTAKAIGMQFIPVYVNNGLMRFGTTEHVRKIFKNLNIEPIILNRESEMLQKLQGITDPERKRKIIGSYYIELFEQEMERLRSAHIPVKFLLQGTIYSDVIESKGSKHAAKIKSHHNVGGLPKNMKLTLLFEEKLQKND